MSDFLAELSHSWGTSPKQKAAEKEYNAKYYREHKGKTVSRPLARQKNVTSGGTGVEKNWPVNLKSHDAKNDVALQLMYKSELQREIDNAIYSRTKAVDELLDDASARKKSALIEFKHGKLFSAAKDFVTGKYYEILGKKAKKASTENVKKLRQYKVHNQHAIDEIARQTRNHKPDNYVTTPSFIPLTNKGR